jgi:non-lysosomal glucosylceramidase
MSVYKKEHTEQISFPLGGIGAGCIGLGGNGRLIDWEIFNHPYKNTSNGFSHIMVRAEKNGEVIDTRVLQGDWPGVAIGGETVNIFRGNGGFGYGMGPYRGSMAGVPHFEYHTFKGEFPFAQIFFRDNHFPANIELCAFNPFIPLNDKDSSLPVAFFDIAITNNSKSTINYSTFFTLNNPLPFGTTINTFKKKNKISAIVLETDRVPKNHINYGNMCIATNANDISYQEYWYRSDWFDSLESYWHDVNESGKLKNRTYTGATGQTKEPYIMNGEDHATLAAHCTLSPNETKIISYVVSWYFPNCANTWNPEPNKDKQIVWQNYYTKLADSAENFAHYAFKNKDRLYDETYRFKDALYSTTLPDYCIEAVSANLSILKTATCKRLENGEFYGFEGSGLNEGVCEGSCSHVWNYAYALPYLFPNLERSIRNLDFTYNQRDDGAMSFRLMLPLGRERYNFRPCVDGQMGGVIKAWREYLICGDIDWLRSHWKAIKKSIEFAWSSTNEDGWDRDQDGVMEGRQHHTMDMELFGPNSWLNGFYLAALLAGSHIAEILGYSKESKLYKEIYEKGRQWTNENLFNGNYFYQKIDLNDKNILLQYDSIASIDGFSAIDAYWNEETSEIKYQIDKGCATDQVIAQWHANHCGLGNIFDEDKTKKALASIFKYNRVETSRDKFNAGRIYVLDNESGVRICAWPDNVKKPSIPLTYADEVFCGLEYQVASHMIQLGMLDEGFSIVKAIRERFDGKRRNPWNEFECGNNYARSLASYSLIPSISGFVCNMGEGYIGFNPPSKEKCFKCFFCIEGGWGLYESTSKYIDITILYGELTLKVLGVPDYINKIEKVISENKIIGYQFIDRNIKYDEPLTLRKNRKLRIVI